MATLVLLLPPGQTHLVLPLDAARELRRLGVTTTTLVRGPECTGLVLSGWDFDADLHVRDVAAIAGVDPMAASMVEVADVQLTP